MTSNIVFKKFDLDQDLLDLGDGLAVCVVATVVLLDEHLNWGLAGCTQGLRLADKIRGLGASLADYPPYLDTIHGAWVLSLAKNTH